MMVPLIKRNVLGQTVLYCSTHVKKLFMLTHVQMLRVCICLVTLLLLGICRPFPRKYRSFPCILRHSKGRVQLLLRSLLFGHAFPPWNA